MTTLLNQLEGQADVVLIALPPLLSYAESLLLASRADGPFIGSQWRIPASTVEAAVDKPRCCRRSCCGSGHGNKERQASAPSVDDGNETTSQDSWRVGGRLGERPFTSSTEFPHSVSILAQDPALDVCARVAISAETFEVRPGRRS